MFLDPEHKTAMISRKLTMPYDSGAWPSIERVADIEQMADTQSRPVEPLGKKQIAGQEAQGVRVPYGDEETLSVWRSTATGRPVLIEQVQTDRAAQQHNTKPLHIIYSDIVFDPPVDDSLFAITAPQGYQVLEADDISFNPATHPASQPAAGQVPITRPTTSTDNVQGPE